MIEGFAMFLLLISADMFSPLNFLMIARETGGTISSDLKGV